MEQTFEQAQHEWLLEKMPELRAKISKLEYELHMAKKQHEYDNMIIKEKSEIIQDYSEKIRRLQDQNDKLLTLINGR